jgi:hypothetical protein
LCNSIFEDAVEDQDPHIYEKRRGTLQFLNGGYRTNKMPPTYRCKNNKTLR